MRYRVYNQQNYSERLKQYFPTYFRTKKEALKYAMTLSGQVYIQRKVGTVWVDY